MRHRAEYFREYDRRPYVKKKRAARHRKWMSNHPLYWRDYRNRNPESTQKNRMRSIAAAQKVKMIVDAAKDKPCVDCGVKYPPFVMDLHHVRGRKEFNIGTRRSISKERLLKEIAKCDVICANCHRIRTHGTASL